MDDFTSPKAELSSFPCRIHPSDSPRGRGGEAPSLSLPRAPSHRPATPRLQRQPGSHAARRCPGQRAQAAARVLAELPHAGAERHCRAAHLWLPRFMPLPPLGKVPAVASHARVLNTFNGARASRQTTVPDTGTVPPLACLTRGQGHAHPQLSTEGSGVRCSPRGAFLTEYVLHACGDWENSDRLRFWNGRLKLVLCRSQLDVNEKCAALSCISLSALCCSSR